MVALARELGAACRISVARLRPAESDVRGRSSTRSKTTGAARQVRGDAEVGFRGLGWVPLRGARQLPAAGSGGGSAKRGRGVTCCEGRSSGVASCRSPEPVPDGCPDRLRMYVMYVCCACMYVMYVCYTIIPLGTLTTEFRKYYSATDATATYLNSTFIHYVHTHVHTILVVLLNPARYS